MHSLDAYQDGMRRLLTQLGQGHRRYSEALTLQSRLQENLDGVCQYGDDETRRAGRAQIVEALNALALETVGTSFNELCESHSSKTVVSNLPSLDNDPVGRDSEFNFLIDAIKRKASPLVIEGMIGMGKSTVANAVAHYCQEHHLFDMFVWWSASYDQRRPLSELLDRIARSLGYRGDGTTLAHDDIDGIYHLLEQRHCLLIITKIIQKMHSEIVDFVERVPSSTCVLITTTSPTILVGEHIRLDPLGAEDAIKLIRSHADRLACDCLKEASDDQLKLLYEASDGFPVALFLAVGLAKKGIRIDKIIRGLRSGSGNFGVLCAHAYDLLLEPAKRVLNMICTSRSSISEESLASILEISEDSLEDEILPQLRDMSLIKDIYEKSWKNRRFSPSSRLIREYYISAISITEPEEDKFIRKASIYYLEQCQLRGFENWSEYDWLEENLDEILAILDWYADTMQWTLYLKMFRSIHYFLGVRGYWHQKLFYGDRAFEAAHCINDSQGQAEILVRILGWTKIQFRQYALAAQDIRDGIEIFERTGDFSGLASAYSYLGTIERNTGNLDQSAKFYEQALCHARSAPDGIRLTGSIKIDLGTMYLKLGHLDECERCLMESRSIFEQSGHQSKIAEVLSRLGGIKLRQGDIEQARKFYDTSQTYAQQINRPKTQAYNLWGFALIAQQCGDRESALNLLQQAKDIFIDLGISDEIVRLDNLLDAVER